MNFYNPNTLFYCGIDLHARTIYICIMNKDRKILVHRQITNNATDLFLKILQPYKHDLVIGAESTFAWYWLADFCADNNIKFILGHALYMKAIHGGKAKNDRIDSKKIALLIQGGMFPLAYVYPKAKRALRDLLRRRLHFVRLRGELFAHLQTINYQNNNPHLPRLGNNKSIRKDVPDLFENEATRKTVEADLDLIKYYDEFIPKLEWHILSKTKQLYQKELAILSSARGMGKIIALTILFEVDSIDRFPSVQDFASYSRVVKCTHESAGKKYGTGGAKIGNAYLKYAFSEAACLMATYNPSIKKYLQKKERKHGKGKSKIILAHKIARAVYFMLKRNTVFDINKFLNN
ncbi:MAG: IS110 family transposase [Candidatus Omnitrophica bacterium]|nr:IS110 family transposase [Candidatus Omnitrophota bacterium]